MSIYLVTSQLSAELHRPDNRAFRLTGVHNSSAVLPHPVRVISSMPTPTQFDVLLPVAAFCFTAFVYTLHYVRSRGLPYPPGPKRIPIIGNLLDMPSHEEWVTYKKWSDQYGGAPSLFPSSSVSCDFNHPRFRRCTRRRPWNAYGHC
jgi:hypothetical protein